MSTRFTRYEAASIYARKCFGRAQAGFIAGGVSGMLLCTPAWRFGVIGVVLAFGIGVFLMVHGSLVLKRADLEYEREEA